jgi:FixJ family two-component response regulator
MNLQPENPPISELRLLVVDHQEERRNHLRQLLLERRIEVLEAESCENALAILADGPVAVVLTETELPTLSGLFLLQKVRQKYPETEVILITHNASSYNLLQALRNGAYDFIVRPIDTGEILNNALDRAFGHIQLRQQNARLLAELERNNRSLSHSLKLFKALNSSIERLAAAGDIEALVMELLTSAVTELQAQRGVLALLDRATERLSLKVGTGISNAACRRFATEIPAGLTTEIVRRGKPVLISGDLPPKLSALAGVDELADLYAPPGLVAAPLVLRQRVVGIVVVSGSPKDHPFCEHEMHFLIQLSHHAALALETAGLIYQLKRTQSGGHGNGHINGVVHS